MSVLLLGYAFASCLFLNVLCMGCSPAKRTSISESMKQPFSSSNFRVGHHLNYFLMHLSHTVPLIGNLATNGASDN